MRFKVLTGVVAIALLLAFVLPIVIKLREPALAVVVLVGLALMFRDLWESLGHGED